MVDSRWVLKITDYGLNTFKTGEELHVPYESETGYSSKFKRWISFSNNVLGQSDNINNGLTEFKFI